MIIAPVRTIRLLNPEVDEVEIINHADQHYGSAGCAEAMIDGVVRYILAAPLRFWTGGGDYIEAIDYRHKFFEPSCMADWIPPKQMDEAKTLQHERFLQKHFPIAGSKCLGMVEGNHDAWFRAGGFASAKKAAAKLGGVFLQEFGLIPLDIEFKYKRKWTVLPANIALWHGGSCALTAGAKVNSLVRAMSGHHVDAFMMGHVHTKYFWPGEQLALTVDRTELVNVPTLGICSGAYLRGYVEHALMYPGRRAMPPSSLGPMAVGISVCLDKEPRLRFRPVWPKV